jgi:hypothetical protein
MGAAPDVPDRPIDNNANSMPQHLLRARADLLSLYLSLSSMLGGAIT